MTDSKSSEERLASIRKLRDDHPNDPLIQAMTNDAEQEELEWQKVSEGCHKSDGSFDFSRLLHNVADLIDLDVNQNP